MNNILKASFAKRILDNNPKAEFSLQPIKVHFEDRDGYMVAGYHIFMGQVSGMINVKGEELWEYVEHPGP